MKIITILVLLQTGVLLLLFGKIVGIEDMMTPAAPGEQEELATDYPLDAQPQNYSNDTYLYPNEDRLRQIIREELHAELDRESEPDKPAQPATVLSPRDSAEMEYQRDQVAQQLEHYASAGSISEGEMYKLQMDIAKLDEAGRSEMLRELSRAFNSGRLAGQL